MFKYFNIMSETFGLLQYPRMPLYFITDFRYFPTSEISWIWTSSNDKSSVFCLPYKKEWIKLPLILMLYSMPHREKARWRFRGDHAGKLWICFLFRSWTRPVRENNWSRMPLPNFILTYGIIALKCVTTWEYQGTGTVSGWCNG